MPACLALPPLPQQLLDTASHIYGEFAPNSSTSSWQTALRVDEPSLLRFHVAPIDIDVDATVLHARDGEVATSARDGVGHEELLLLPLAVANEYTLLLRFSGAQRSDCPALRIEASLTPARLLRGQLLELNAACPAEPMYPELDLAPLEAHRPVTLRPVPPSCPRRMQPSVPSLPAAKRAAPGSCTGAIRLAKGGGARPLRLPRRAGRTECSRRRMGRRGAAGGRRFRAGATALLPSGAAARADRREEAVAAARDARLRLHDGWLARPAPSTAAAAAAAHKA